ncbi:MAG: MFS transporter [Odoribacter splanchnicus]
MQNSKTFLLVLLGILAAFGPFVTDMYLPGLPSMTVYFDTTASMVQLGITTAMLGLGFGQIIVGPLSDKYGRKLPLLLSLWLFIFSTIVCSCSWSIGAFIFFVFSRNWWAGGIVISRSVATDCYGGKELAKAFAMISAVNGLAPILAPVGEELC